MKILMLLMIVLAASVGQVFLKLAVAARPMASAAGEGWRAYLALATNGYLWIGVALYAFTSVAWLWALRNFPLSKAYPILALTFVAVPLLARLVFGERITPSDWLGMVLILAGVAITGAKL